ncbi:hypothetical protein GCM10008922_01570 [Faecalicatena contorta]
MIVSVKVSIAVSPITGAASFSRIREMSLISLPILPMACFRAALMAWVFATVPFVPVVGQEALVRK